MRGLSIGSGSGELADTRRTLREGVRGLEQIRSESSDGAIEKLEAQLVEHYTCDVDGTGNEPLSLVRRMKMT